MTHVPDGAGERFAGERRNEVRATAFWAAVGGGLMLWYGWGEWSIPDRSAAYAAAARVWIQTLKIGGGVMLGVAGLCLTGRAGVLLLDAVACGAIALLLAVCGAILAVYGDTNGFLSLVFSLLWGGAAVQSWRAYADRPRLPGDAPRRDGRSTDAVPSAGSGGDASRSDAPPAPASDASAPVEGYLAALVREHRRRRDGQ